MGVNEFDRLFQKALEDEGYIDEDIDKIAASLTSLDIEDVTQAQSAKKKGEAFAEGFIETLKRHGISPSDAATILKVAAGAENVPEVGSGSTQPNVDTKDDAVASKHVDPTVQNPTNVDEEPKPNPNKNVPMTDTFDEEDLNKLVSALGTTKDPVQAAGGQAKGPVNLDPNKELAKKIVEVANGLIAQGVDKEVAIEAAKAAVTAPETEVTREVAKQEAQKTEAVADIDEALDVLEKAVTQPIAEAATATTEEAAEGTEEAEVSPEEVLAKAAALMSSMSAPEQLSALFNPYMTETINPYAYIPVQPVTPTPAVPVIDPTAELLKEAALMDLLYGPYSYDDIYDPYNPYIW